MTVIDFFQRLESWQTLIAGLIGFGGLAWVNFRASQIANNQYETERKALVAAVALESDEICRELQTIIRLIEEHPRDADYGKLISEISDNMVYNENISKTSLLPLKFLESLLEFLFEKRDLKRKYCAFNVPDDADEVLAALRACVELSISVRGIANELVPELEAQVP